MLAFYAARMIFVINPYGELNFYQAKIKVSHLLTGISTKNTKKRSNC